MANPVSAAEPDRGDLAPTSLLTRTLAIAIGVRGVLVTALVAAIAVQALTVARDDAG